MTDHLAKYCQYVANTGYDPLPLAMFDKDWTAIGPMARADMVAARLATETPAGIKLTDRGWRLAAPQ